MTKPPSSPSSHLDTDWVFVGISANHQNPAINDPRPPVSMAESIPSVPSVPPAEPVSMSDRIIRVAADLDELNKFYNISISPRRHARLSRFFAAELAALSRIDFPALPQHSRIDFLLLRNHLRRNAAHLRSEQSLAAQLHPLMPFAPLIISLCEARQDVSPLAAHDAARRLDDIKTLVAHSQAALDDAPARDLPRTASFKASGVVSELRGHLQEFFTFYCTYSPSFDWWVAQPWQDADAALTSYATAIRTKLVGLSSSSSSSDDDIIGDPIGEAALLSELAAEMIAYSPRELIAAAHEHYRWCESEMARASSQLGHHDDWKAALAHVKTLHAAPGEQPSLVRALITEAITYVSRHDLVSVPPLAAESIRMLMMSADTQKYAPFFLGGRTIQVAAPTRDMPHALKTSVMRANNRHFARATAFHEMIPGHRLQLFVADRSNPHRASLTPASPFSVEGWATYWELSLWRRGDFFASPQDRIGTLFWRMNRCARIVFSLSFHLGEWDARRCVDLLVDWVGHDRATAEGEVRRSLSGDYGPLYQAAYLVGALQLARLRDDVLRRGMSEKEFHDLFLQASYMPIELFRALAMDLELTADHEACWRFLD